jgi:hypothetical protein
MCHSSNGLQLCNCPSTQAHHPCNVLMVQQANSCNCCGCLSLCMHIQSRDSLAPHGVLNHAHTAVLQATGCAIHQQYTATLSGHCGCPQDSLQAYIHLSGAGCKPHKPRHSMVWHAFCFEICQSKQKPGSCPKLQGTSPTHQKQQLPKQVHVHVTNPITSTVGNLQCSWLAA